MIFFDTDTLTLFLTGNEKISKRVEQIGEEDEIAITVITRIEVLQGRFAFILKAADSIQLERAMALLERSDQDLEMFRIFPIDPPAAVEFEKLRKNKKLKKIGRADLLIASIALAQKVKLITRNTRHFEQIPGLQIENWAD